jgi:hypothetical protein
MNRKHVVQFLATVGAVVIIYVLSYAPLVAFIDAYNKNRPTELGMPHSVSYLRFFAPVQWLEGASPLFKSLNLEYRNQCFVFFRTKT